MGRHHRTWAFPMYFYGPLSLDMGLSNFWVAIAGHGPFILLWAAIGGHGNFLLFWAAITGHGNFLLIWAAIAYCYRPLLPDRPSHPESTMYYY